MTHSLTPLFALGLNDIIFIVVALVSLVTWVMKQMADAQKQQAAQQAPPDLQAGLPPQAAAPAAPAKMDGGAAPADPMRAQVDEFLRRAGQAKQAAAPKRPPRQAAGRDEIVVLIEDKPPEPGRKSSGDPRTRSAAAAALRAQGAAKPKTQRERRPVPEQPRSVAEHVAEHVGAATQQIREEVSHLGERVKQADQQFDVQLQQKFDHELGSLAGRHASRVSDQQASAATVSPAGQIAALLANPEGVRQAIVLNEILNRPHDRW